VPDPTSTVKLSVVGVTVYSGKSVALSRRNGVRG